MARVVSRITIDGPVGAVFDVVTTTRHWPRWHPATEAVGGVTDHPLALGDVVRERARIGARVYEGEWTVVEHARPSRVVLRAGSGRLSITYDFSPAGDGTAFTRELEYRPADFGGATVSGAIEGLMRQQSDEGLRRLKALVEALLADDRPSGAPPALLEERRP